MKRKLPTAAAAAAAPADPTSSTCSPTATSSNTTSLMRYRLARTSRAVLVLAVSTLLALDGLSTTDMSAANVVMLAVPAVLLLVSPVEARIGSGAADHDRGAAGGTGRKKEAAPRALGQELFAARYPLLFAEMERRSSLEAAAAAAAAAAEKQEEQEYHRQAAHESYVHKEYHEALEAHQGTTAVQYIRSLQQQSSSSEPLISITIDTPRDDGNDSDIPPVSWIMSNPITDLNAHKSRDGTVQLSFTIERPVEDEEDSTTQNTSDTTSTTFQLEMNLVGLATGSQDGLSITVIDDAHDDGHHLDITRKEDGTKKRLAPSRDDERNKPKKPAAPLESPIVDTQIVEYLP